MKRFALREIASGSGTKACRALSRIHRAFIARWEIACSRRALAALTLDPKALFLPFIYTILKLH